MSEGLTQDQVDRFDRDGYLHLSQLFDAEEARMLRDAAHGDDSIRDHAFNVEDTTGKKSTMTLWNHPGDDLFGRVARCHRVVDAAEALLGGEVYHYHSKLSMKEPKVGGAWEWHQDYGYWYQNGCLFPDMLSCIVALDPATKENGCMQVLRGSHKMGRIEHGVAGEQTGADMERVDEALKVLPLVNAEMQPGDAFFFHSNTLHCSAPNESDDPRWLLICCYNARSNNPYKEHHHPQYTPLEKVPDAAIKQYGAEGLDTRRTYLNIHDDETTAAGKD